MSDPPALDAITSEAVSAAAASSAAATSAAVSAAAVSSAALQVWIDQDECTGDGLCVQYAPEVFEFDIDGLAYVKTVDGELLQVAGARTDVPDTLRLDVLESAKECPGNCIHVVRISDGVVVGGPLAE